MDRFKLFLVNEDKSYLGHRVGDVLTSLQDVQEDLPNLGSRHLTKLAEQLVNQIRKILHDNWNPKNQKHLKELQKIAVAIMKTIEEKGDLKEILPVATRAMEELSGKLGVKVNSLSAPEPPGEDLSPEDFELTGNGPPGPQDIPQQEMPQDEMPDAQM